MAATVVEWAGQLGEQVTAAYTAWDSAQSGERGLTLTHRIAGLLAVAPTPMTAA